jgi:outer membrane protein assembly factor BamB
MRIRFLALTVAVVSICGCDSGGGGGGQIAPAAVWGQFRHDNQRTGFGVGFTQNNDAIVDFEVVDPPSLDGSRPSAISGSPAIDADGRIYIATEGGTLASFESGDDVERRWTVNRCGRCPAGEQHLGALVSSPAVYTFEDIDGVEQTSVFLGSMDNAVFLYHFSKDDLVDESSCEICFWRGDAALKEQFLVSDRNATVNAEFVSSPTFTANLGTGSIAGIFIGARITIERSDGSTEVQGKLYAINQDGSLRWEFPRAGEPPIGPVTSSPVFAVGQTLFFTADADPRHPGRGDVLYSLTEGGNLKRSVAIAGLSDPQLLFSPSPMTSATVFVHTVDGVINAMNPDGTFLWASAVPGQRIVNSLVVGSQNEETETPEPEETPTPTGTLTDPSVTSTPTPTETPLRLNSNVLGITETGMLLVLDSGSGNIVPPSGRSPTAAIQGTVVSSPALSGDLFMIFGTTGGQLFSLDTATAQLPQFCDGGNDDGNLCTSDADCVDGFCADSFWPLLLPRSCTAGEHRSQFCNNDDDCPGGVCVRPAIRSSPSIDLDGTIYFGADDGRLYAVDVVEDITPRETRTPTPTPPPGATHTRTATTTPPATIPLTVTPTITATATEIETIAPSASPTETQTAAVEATDSPTPAESPTPEATPSSSPADTATPEPPADSPTPTP